MSRLTLSTSPEARAGPGDERTARSQLSEFTGFCESHTGRDFGDSAAFHAFSVAEPRLFWGLFLDWSGLLRSGDPEPVRDGDRCESARFFPNLQLSYAENLLRLDEGFSADAPALAAHHPFRPPEHVTRGALHARVVRLAAHLQALGVGHRDHVVALAGNNAELVIAGLGAAAVGATFSSASLDMGTPALVSRFGQLAPKLLFANLIEGAATGSAVLSSRIGELAGELPSLKAVVALDAGPAPEHLLVPLERLSALLESPAGGEESFAWTHWPFDHPQFVLFSSGTTGAPKGIVHGAGGTLLEHVKEQRLHVDLQPHDKLFFHTSAAWMMWNWQLSALASGCEIVLYDGPISGPETLWEIVASEGVTVFGTSPAYLQLCQDCGFSPRRALNLSALRTVLSTGAILHDHQYDWCAAHVGEVQVQSISGGTDIIGCFVLGHPDLPVRRGWIQCRSLGMDVQALPEAADSPASGSVGELVCRNPFPSRPVRLLGDDRGDLHNAYFRENPGMWTHGDLIEFDPDGHARMHGRSDGVLEIDGVRVGPAEIYRALQGIAEVRDALAFEWRGADPRGYSRSVLLVVLHPPQSLDGRLTVRIRRAIVECTAPTHVPELVVQVEELPVTHSGKHSERAARDALSGEAVVNTHALRNPGSLDQIRGAVHAAERELIRLGRASEPEQASTEQVLKGIWETVLGVAPLCSSDNFFAVGGTSLAAVRVFQAVHDRMGVDLPLSTLMRAQTIADMAAVIDSPSESGVPCLVLLSDGQAGRPLFLVHSLTGDVLQLRSLAMRLGANRPVYGVQALGLDPTRQPQEHVEEMAATYVAVIRSVQESGPYDLAGHSFGGLVAFEMARQLDSLGQKVGWVGLIDTNLHPACLSAIDRLRFRAAQPFHFLRAGLRAPRTRMNRYLRKALLRVAPGLPIAPPVPLWELPPLLRRLEAVSLRAYADYRPRPYAGKATFFRAHEREPSACNPLRVWPGLLGNIEVEHIPGGHLDAIAEPNVQVLAERITAKLV